MNSLTNNQSAHEIKQIFYSTNPLITPNQTKEKAAEITNGWKLESCNWSEPELTTLVKTKAYICSKLQDGHKTKSNVEEVYMCALDFDNKAERSERFTKDEFIEKASKWQFSWFLHTTISHHSKYYEDGTPIDRFRVLIPFLNPVSDNFLRDNLKEFWLSKFPQLDPTSFQGERYYMISPNAETYFHEFRDGEGKHVFINPEIANNSGQPTGVKNKSNSTKSNEMFKMDWEVTLSDNKTIKKVFEISSHTPVFCPFCIHDSAHRGNPTSANAFVDINSVGYHFIYCSSEDKTYWPDPKDTLLKNVKLFWNTTVGRPCQTDYTTPESLGEQKPAKTIYVFKNNDDFKNFCTNESIPYSLKTYLIRAGIIFNPKLSSGLNGQYYNLFEETDYMKKDYSQLQALKHELLITELDKRVPVISELLKNIFGDDEYVLRFLNWIGFLLQKREKAFTAWLVQSKEQGVGKDFLFNFILRPLFGEKQSQLLNGSRIAKQFNSMDLHCFLRGYNEVFTNKDSATNTFRKEWLKDRITGKEQDIEFKGVDTYSARNYMNFILFSNNDMAIALDQNDRRYNVVKNEKAKKVKDLSFYINEDHLPDQVNSELEAFAEIVFTLEVDRELANTAITTAAKDQLIGLSKDNYDKFIDALASGDSDYFMLDEVFQPTHSDLLFNSSTDNNTESSVSKEVRESISIYKAIPSRYMNSIIKFHFPKNQYRESLDRLKQKNLITNQKRFGGGQNQKVYMVK